MKFIIILLSSLLFSNEFSEGPYGNGYYDVAASFSVKDLNISVEGDVNQDDILNIQDIIIVVGEILGTISLDNEAFSIGDINNDSIIDILDIVKMVDNVMSGQSSDWVFEEEWTGDESYIFIHYQGSSALWYAADIYKQQLLSNSPDNVHYFFISSRSSYEDDVTTIKEQFDEILLSSFSEDEQSHWKSHLHFVPQHSLSMDNWLSEALNGKSSMGINQMQQIMQTGYLGNPANFSGTYINYLAHEAIFYDYQYRTFIEPTEDYNEVEIFDAVDYGGGGYGGGGSWSPTITSIVELPQTGNYDRVSVEAFMPCADYTDASCDDYDRIASMAICQGVCYMDYNSSGTFDPDEQIDETYEECSSNGFSWEFNYDCHEIAEWITPFDRQPHSLTDISPYLAMMYPGGPKMFKFYVSGWPNSVITLKLRFFEAPLNALVRKEFIPLWGGGGFYSDGEFVYNDNHQPIAFNIPVDAKKVEFTTYITGHGWGSDSGNCAEFCNTIHKFTVNGGVANFQKDHPTAGSNNYCMQPSTIAQGVIPNQYGTWGYGRQGWCPGLDVKPFVQDISNYISLGDENISEYEICWAPNGSCTSSWPTITDPSGYLANIHMSSALIISY